MSSANPFSRRSVRAVSTTKPPDKGTRCTYYVNGVILCDAFPSWVQGDDERRCADHKDK